MPKGYWIAHVRVTDAQTYTNYIAANAAAFAKYGARFVVRAGRFEAVEGKLGERHVVIEFPSYDAALACYHSAEYKAALDIRKSAAEGQLVIVEGVA
jgi:uncharacterized protein (DUF1330 family)